jgi:site-specific DNA-methyltransferase (adenine-specific)
MAIQDKAEKVLQKAKEFASGATSWMEFSNRLFAEPDGLVPKTFPRMTERREFYKLGEYEQLNSLLADLIRRMGIDDGRAAKKSGKFLVRLPKSLHAALDVEAEQEGVSLNQLAVAKLASPLRRSLDPYKAKVIEAFVNIYDGFSSDRVIVHPELNAKYLAECRRLGLDQSDYELNHKLYDIRKGGKSLLPPATKKPQVKGYDEFLFASEIAFRYLQQREGVSLDRVMCDPKLRERFDEIAKRMAPRQSEFNLRMGAIYLRKTHNLPPEDETIPKYDLLTAGTISQIQLNSLPTYPGMYAFYEHARPIFAGETKGLRHRISLHLSSSGRLFLPEWLELGIERSLELKYVAVPNAKTQDRLDWLNVFVNRERPLMNYIAA